MAALIESIAPKRASRGLRALDLDELGRMLNLDNLPFLLQTTMPGASEDLPTARS
jgi:hypothetical protein